MVQGVWCCACGDWDKKESLIYKPISLWDARDCIYRYALVYIYTHSIYHSRHRRSPFFPALPGAGSLCWCRAGCQQLYNNLLGKGNLCSLDKCPGQKLENLTEKKATLWKISGNLNFRGMSCCINIIIDSICQYWSTALFQWGKILLCCSKLYNNKQEMLHIRSFATLNMVIYYNT